MKVTCFLCRYLLGWYEVNEPTWGPYRGEALLALGALQSDHEVERVARQQLAVLGNARTVIACDLGPTREADTPYLGFAPGDYVTVPDEAGSSTRERVMAISVAEDDNGLPSYAPELKDVVLTDQERWQQNLDKLANGSLAGNSPVAQPPATVPGNGKDCCAPNPETGGGVG